MVGRGHEGLGLRGKQEGEGEDTGGSGTPGEGEGGVLMTLLVEGVFGKHISSSTHQPFNKKTAGPLNP